MKWARAPSLLENLLQTFDFQVLTCSVAVRLAIAAVIAHHCGFDKAGSIGVGARRHREHAVARMEVEERRSRPRGLGHRSRMAGDCLTHEGSQLLFSHPTTSTVSMIPTTAASTGASFLPSASPAARPSITIR